MSIFQNNELRKPSFDLESCLTDIAYGVYKPGPVEIRRNISF